MWLIPAPPLPAPACPRCYAHYTLYLHHLQMQAAVPKSKAVLFVPRRPRLLPKAGGHARLVPRGRQVRYRLLLIFDLVVDSFSLLSSSSTIYLLSSICRHRALPSTFCLLSPLLYLIIYLLSRPRATAHYGGCLCPLLLAKLLPAVSYPYPYPYLLPDACH